jgi:hypothetical protein
LWCFILTKVIAILKAASSKLKAAKQIVRTIAQDFACGSEARLTR